MIIGAVKQIWRYPVKSMGGEQLADCTVGELGIPGDRGWALRDEKKREITNGKNIPLLMQASARYRQQPRDDYVPHVDMTLNDGATIGSDDENAGGRLSQAFGRSVTLWSRQPASNKAHYRRASIISRLIGFKLVRDQLPRLLRMNNVQSQIREVFSREPDEPVPDLTQLPLELLEFTSPLGTYFDAFPIHVLTTASLAAMAQLNPGARWDPRRFRPNFLIETKDNLEGLVEASWAGRTLRIGEVELKCEIPTVRCGMTMQAQVGLPKDPSILRSIVKEADQNLGIYASVVCHGSVALNDSVELL
ncbi:MAG: MOSC N-terminal beta barrel domain-containing protein [Acidobacteriota bacterium]|nr:MOSC N-terminal beta barrel domain-containing protein [Acidobacteriota bacterium]